LPDETGEAQKASPFLHQSYLIKGNLKWLLLLPLLVALPLVAPLVPCLMLLIRLSTSLLLQLPKVLPWLLLTLNAGFEVITVAGGESSDNAWDLGVTGVDADVFVDGFDGDAAAAGAYAQNAAAFQPVVIGTADTIDLLIQAATTAPTSGSLRVWAVLVSVDGRPTTDAVDRDQLA